MTVLTSTVINNAEIKEKIYYIWDDMVKGFALKVIPNGQKKYIIKYRTAMGGRSGVQRWYIFGDIQNLSCKEAREEAAKLFRMIHEGKDPQAEKASLREADTLTEFWELYVKDYASLKENKENYLKHTEPLWRLLSNIEDSFEKIYRQIGQSGLNEALKSTFTQFNELVERGEGAADTIGKTLATAVNIASDAFFLLAEHADVALTILSVRLGSSAIMGGINLLKAGVGYLQVSLAGLSVSAKSAVTGIAMMSQVSKLAAAQMAILSRCRANLRIWSYGFGIG